MSTDKPLTLMELLARLDHPGHYVNEARSDGKDGKNNDGKFWICESQLPGRGCEGEVYEIGERGDITTK
jgi:hypothetical protein